MGGFKEEVEKNNRVLWSLGVGTADSSVTLQVARYYLFSEILCLPIRALCRHRAGTKGLTTVTGTTGHFKQAWEDHAFPWMPQPKSENSLDWQIEVRK